MPMPSQPPDRPVITPTVQLPLANERPRVSVVMAAYNYGPFIAQAIQSVVDQTFTDWELIVVDDGSTDDTSAVVAPLLDDPRVRYRRQENRGQPQAKNRGVELSRGDLVAFLDADDAWLLVPLGDSEEAPVGVARLHPDGSVQVVANITEYQETDPDPNDLEDIPTESNPYGLTVLPGGDALVVDAAGNDLLRITEAGEITTVAVFTPEMTSTDHLPPGFFDDPSTEEVEEGPPALPAEAVPTTVTVGPDGHAYVGQLNGFPFRPGNAKIWRVDPNAEDAVCTADGATPGCDVAYTGFTAIQDIDFAPNGKL